MIVTAYQPVITVTATQRNTDTAVTVQSHTPILFITATQQTVERDAATSTLMGIGYAYGFGDASYGYDDDSYGYVLYEYIHGEITIERF
jgi:hypothetical protein